MEAPSFYRIHCFIMTNMIIHTRCSLNNVFFYYIFFIFLTLSDLLVINLRWEFIKESMKKGEKTCSTKKPTKKRRKFFLSFLGRFLGRERVFFLFFLAIVVRSKKKGKKTCSTKKRRQFFLFSLIAFLVKSVFFCYFTCFLS